MEMMRNLSLKNIQQNPVQHKFILLILMVNRAGVSTSGPLFYSFISKINFVHLINQKDKI